MNKSPGTLLQEQEYLKAVQKILTNRLGELKSLNQEEASDYSRGYQDGLVWAIGIVEEVGKGLHANSTGSIHF